MRRLKDRVIRRLIDRSLREVYDKKLYEVYGNNPEDWDEIAYAILCGLAGKEYVSWEEILKERAKNEA